MSDSQTDRIAAAFCARSLPADQWTHEAHLRVGLWHLVRYSPNDALKLLRERITVLNDAHGVSNTDDSGYHETITRFFLRQIERFLAAADCNRPLDDLATELIAVLGNKSVPLEYYSPERLFSAQARRGWIEPDLQPLP